MATPVTASVKPGPAVTTQTPGFPVSLPQASAMCAAACSCRARWRWSRTWKKELRAWSVPDGSTAVEAAGAIHTDLARGFIRAEVIGPQELVELGSTDAAKSAGKLRTEGKDYPVQDGDVILVRFNL